MIRLHVPLPGPFVWVPNRRRRRPSGRHTIALLAIVAIVVTALHVVLWTLVVAGIVLAAAMFLRGLRER